MPMPKATVATMTIASPLRKRIKVAFFSCGEGGARLSGGQGRRIALARTLLQHTPIVILDEPTTGLDADTERAFLETLDKTLAERTVILIAHRLTGHEKLDRVWWLDQGHLSAAA